MNQLRQAFRIFLKNPGFSAIVLLTLALGIGANTAIFSFVNAILLKPLPYEKPEQLVMVFENHPVNGWKKFWVGAPLLAEWRRQSTVFAGLAARAWNSFVLSGNTPPENIAGSRLSANIFRLLGIKPFLGRDFLPEEETYGKHRVALLSYEFWQRRFGGETNIIGQSISLNAEPYTVIGVMPPKTLFPEPQTQLWTPLAFSPDELPQRHAHNYPVYARLKPGITLEQAREEMKLIARRMEEADPQNKGWGAEVHPLHEMAVGESRRVLLVLLGAVGLVLLIACVNIANLLLARSAARSREFAIRAALGATRGQMLRQLLTENLFLAVLGGSGGILLAWFGLQGLVRFSPPDFPRVAEGIFLDGWTLGFTVLVSLTTGLLFGFVPALQASNPALTRDLNDSSRGSSAGRQRQRIRAALVVSEVALSLILLASAGLMIRSFSRLLSQSLGYNPQHLVTMGIGLPPKKYPELQDRARFFYDLLRRVQVLSGVESAALVLGLPLSGQNSQLTVTIPEAPPPAPGQAVSAGYAQVSPEYFRTMNMPLLQGRDFTDQDRSNSPPVVIVDETFVKNFKLGTNVLGRLIGIGDGTDGVEIIGLVKDTKRTGMVEAPRGEMYRTYQQMSWGYMNLVVRSQRDPADLTRAIRAELDSIDKDQALENVRTVTQLVRASIAQRRLSVQLLGAFAGVAMLLAAIGLYGVLSYNLAQRTQEIGIRMALGAQARDVQRLVLGQGMTLAGIGIAIGLAGGLGVTRVMRNLLFGISPHDPLTFGAITVLLAGVALLACWLPARRATQVEPMVALRYD